MGHGEQVLHPCKRSSLTAGEGPLCCEIWGLYKTAFKSWRDVKRCIYKRRLWSLFHKKIFCFQFSSVTQSCSTPWDPMDCSTPGLPVHHQLPELTQIHIHRVSDAIQPSHPRSSPSPPTFNLSQHQGLFQWFSSSHQVAKVLECQLQHHSFQWIFRTGFL